MAVNVAKKDKTFDLAQILRREECFFFGIFGVRTVEKLVFDIACIDFIEFFGGIDKVLGTGENAQEVGTKRIEVPFFGRFAV